MLAIILIYFIGKQFYNLATEFEKSKWLFPFVGVVVYFIGCGIGGVVVNLFIDSLREAVVDELEDSAITVVILPFGIGSSVILYRVLKQNWKKELQNSSSDILDDDFLKGEGEK